MAIEKPTLTPAWENPTWPDQLPDATDMRILYGAFADELVVRFGNRRGHGEIVVPVTTPEVDYAGLLVALDTGAVVGIHVYPLVAFAIQRHPAWRAAAEPNPAPKVADQIVSDIKDLFDRYGIEDPDSN